MFVVINGAWRPLADLEKVPPRAILSLGAQFRADGFHWEGFVNEMSERQLLKEFGGLTIVVSIDGTKWTWTYTVDELRNQIAANKQETEDNWFKNPMNRPKLKGKQV
jgi:hypothetical protein